MASVTPAKTNVESKSETETVKKEDYEVEDKNFEREKVKTDPNFKRKIVWKNVIGFIFLHSAALYGLFLAITAAKLLTNIWAFFVLILSGQGVLMGAHRYYSHRGFKASWQLRLLLVACQTIAGQNCLYIWVRDHRQHHKYSDTDADPHNANRGFFFSHMGWLMSRKHPKVIEKGKGIDMSDLEADPFVMIQKKYYKTLYTILAIYIPTLVPYYFWGENIYTSLFVCYFFRYVLMLHGTWLVNSVAHLYGNRPYDKDLKPVENLTVAKITMGEGWHNYHHAFPWDYRAAELGYRDASLTTQLIDFMERIGWAKDLRTASCDMVRKRTLRKGDGSHTVITESTAANKNGEILTTNNKRKSSLITDKNHQNEKLQNGHPAEDAEQKKKSEELTNGVPRIRKLESPVIRNKVFNRG
ncbi:hypothetical protein J437_LFUL007035 [Ladona fulva]|uniref:Fatty acid desaturase domain-containing protein n=1 Tax=Ladona fulva TaxID=123851 RepID=A0A8K0K4Q7_LADFU|nr:hypothetical protein J437_LFUL007035 [Ladona fulva]